MDFEEIDDFPEEVKAKFKSGDVEEVDEFPDTMLHVGDGPDVPMSQWAEVFGPAIDRALSKDLTAIDAVASGLAQGMTSKFDDEIIGFMRTLVEDAEDDGLDDETFEERYNIKRNEVRKYNELLAKKFPGIVGTGEVVGFGATLPKSVAAAGAKGFANMAGRGAVWGAGEAEEIEDIPREAMIGAAEGLVAQGVTRGLAKGVGKTFPKAGSALAKAGTKFDDKAEQFVKSGIPRGVDKVSKFVPESARKSIMEGTRGVTDPAVKGLVDTLAARGMAGMAKKIEDAYVKNPDEFLKRFAGRAGAAWATGGTSVTAELGARATGKGLKWGGKGMHEIGKLVDDPEYLLQKTRNSKYYKMLVTAVNQGNLNAVVHQLLQEQDFRDIVGYETGDQE